MTRAEKIIRGAAEKYCGVLYREAEDAEDAALKRSLTAEREDIVNALHYSRDVT